MVHPNVPLRPFAHLSIPMKRIFGSIIDIRKGEASLTSLMFIYYYLILVTTYFLKPSRDSLFLARLGAEQLPLVFILIAVIVMPVTTSYARLARSLSLTKLINITTAILIVSLFILRNLIDLDQTWVYYLFYIWVSIYGVLSTSQFWLFANTIFNSTQAKRLFPLLNVGGILGAVTGGEVTSFIVQVARIPTENLLYFCMGFLVICIGLLNLMWRLKEKTGEDLAPPPSMGDQQRDSVGQMIESIRRSRSLEFIVGIIATMAIVNAFVDFQFKSISASTFPDEADLTAFMGKFYGRVGLIPLFIQIFLSTRLLRSLGLGGVILLLPGSLMLGSAALFVTPALWTSVFLRGADQSFRYSLNKTGLELLFLPVPMDLKKRTKVFIDVTIDQVAQGVSGLLLLLCTLVLGLSLRSLSLVIIAFCGFWIFLAIRAHAEYVNAFRKALERREINLDDLGMSLGDASSIDTLTRTLKSNNERQVIYALDMLMSSQTVDLVSSIRPLLIHASPEIRYKSLQVLRNSTYDVPESDIEPLLNDEDPDVRVEALALLCDQSSDPVYFLSTYLDNQDIKIKTAVIVCIAKYYNTEAQALINEDIIQALLTRNDESGASLRIQIAGVMGALNVPELRPYLIQLMDDPSIVVARQAIEGTGATRDPVLIPVLLNKLRESTYRASARNALAIYGNSALDVLQKSLIDESVDLGIRRNIPRVLRQIPTQESVDILLNALNHVPPTLTYPIVKTLNKLRQYPTLHIDESLVNAVLIDESRIYYEMVAIQNIPWEERHGLDLLKRSLKDKQNQSLELIFRLLGLQYPPQDIYNAYEGIISQDVTLKANAIEFLDNILKNDIKRYLLPIIDPVSVQETIQQGQVLFGFQLNNTVEALIYLIRGRDIWMQACAMVTLKGDEGRDLLELVEQAKNNKVDLIRETAIMVMDKVNSRPKV